MQYSNSIDNRADFILCRYGEGVTLSNSNDLRRQHCRDASRDPISLAEMDDLPLDIYFYRTDTTFFAINQATASSCGFDSAVIACNKSIFQSAIAKYADRLIRNNRSILEKKVCKIFDEEIMCKDGSYHHGISIKMPWYQDHKVAGVFGCTIVDGKHSLVESLNQIVQLGLINSASTLLGNVTPIRTHDVNLSKLESTIIQHTLKGKTAKEIASVLHLSPRTVENYLAAIKNKVGVSKKSELIEFFLQ